MSTDDGGGNGLGIVANPRVAQSHKDRVFRHDQKPVLTHDHHINPIVQENSLLGTCKRFMGPYHPVFTHVNPTIFLVNCIVIADNLLIIVCYCYYFCIYCICGQTTAN